MQKMKADLPISVKVRNKGWCDPEKRKKKDIRPTNHLDWPFGKDAKGKHVLNGKMQEAHESFEQC